MFSKLTRALRRTLVTNNVHSIIRHSCVRCQSGKVSFTGRTSTCGALNISNVGQQVQLSGWLQFKRQQRFFVLRDWDGTVQLHVQDNKLELLDTLNGLYYESVLAVTGKVIQRPEGQANPSMKTGQIEVEVEDIKVLNTAPKSKPIVVREKISNVTEAVRMEFRYLDIRREMMQHNLRLRSKMIMKMREFLANEHEFVDVETPTLFRRTPGGAKEFIVPTHQQGKFYSLPQSPQQFKQLLMVGGIDRYFQVARCYRDEGAKPERQPEFTQLDIEMSFVKKEGILSMVEEMLKYSWPSTLPALSTPFPRISYEDAMRLYGVDKPDTRFDMKIADYSSSFKGCGHEAFEKVLENEDGSVVALKIPYSSHISSSMKKRLLKSSETETIKPYVGNIGINEDRAMTGTLATKISAPNQQKIIKDLGLKPKDYVVYAAGRGYEPHQFLGRLRLQLAGYLTSAGINIRQADEYKFLWVEDFPLFFPKEDGDGLESAHHPFTDVHDEDREHLSTHPHQVRGQHYDLVLNGSEIGGGSIRIHDPQLQRHVLEDILKEDSSELEHLIQALGSGCPPHGGIALGLDRLFAILCNAPSIRDVIAFPKSVEGNDLMSKAPSEVSRKELDYYHIQVKSQSKSQNDCSQEEHNLKVETAVD